MRTLVLTWILFATTAHADPGWSDVPALVAAATSPVEAELRTCVTKLPFTIAFYATRTKSGTHVAMPMPPVGVRGYTAEERCRMTAIAKISLPALPLEVDRVLLGHRVGDIDTFEPAWRDLGAAIGVVLTDARRASLAACAPAARTVQLQIDRPGTKTRIWLPDWQFHSESGDGSTPPAQKVVKACLTKTIATWTVAQLPTAMPELQLAIPVAPKH